MPLDIEPHRRALAAGRAEQVVGGVDLQTERLEIGREMFARCLNADLSPQARRTHLEIRTAREGNRIVDHANGAVISSTQNGPEPRDIGTEHQPHREPQPAVARVDHGELPRLVPTGRQGVDRLLATVPAHLPSVAHPDAGTYASRMTGPLDDSWVQRCDTALRARGPKGDPLTIAHVVTHADREFRYFVAIDAHGSRAATGSPDHATVTFRQSAEVATAIRAGELAAGEAILLGRVIIEGDASALIEHREVLAELDAVLAAVV